MSKENRGGRGGYDSPPAIPDRDSPQRGAVRILLALLAASIGTGDGIAQTQHTDLPPNGHENREKIPESIKAREGIVRVQANPERGNQRVLHPEENFEQRTANKDADSASLGAARATATAARWPVADDSPRHPRHAGQVQGVRLKYEVLSDKQKETAPDFSRFALIFERREIVPEQWSKPDFQEIGLGGECTPCTGTQGACELSTFSAFTERYDQELGEDPMPSPSRTYGDG